MGVLVLVDGVVAAGVEDPEPGEVVGAQALADEDAGGRQHRFGDLVLGARMDTDEGVGLFDARGEDPPRSVEVRRVPAVEATGGDEGAGDRVPGESLVGDAVDGEGDRSVGVDARGPVETGADSGSGRSGLSV